MMGQFRAMMFLFLFAPCSNFGCFFFFFLLFTVVGYEFLVLLARILPFDSQPFYTLG